VDRARGYATERTVFDRPIGKNQGVQFPIARAYANVRAADASWEAANMCLQTFGGFGFAADYDVERKFRETRLYQVAPISTNLILSYISEHVLGLPRSF
jgi:acyl-CoA dehydrogenase